jgi:hypothetical protein
MGPDYPINGRRLRGTGQIYANYYTRNYSALSGPDREYSIIHFRLHLSGQTLTVRLTNAA